MGICDVCNRPTPSGGGTWYTADEFRQIVTKGFEPDGILINNMITMFGISKQQAVAQWKGGLVSQSKTPWSLCSSCAARASYYMPKPAGTGPPAGQKLTEPITQEMLKPVWRKQASKSPKSVQKKWWKFWEIKYNAEEKITELKEAETSESQIDTD